MPFEGQGVKETIASKPVVVEERQPSYAATENKSIVKKIEAVERKIISKPSAKLMTANIGIKDILSPPKNQQAENLEALLPDHAENFSIEQLKKVWHDYAIELKKAKKDSLYATLTGSELQVTSDYQITLEISNSAQAIDLEREKAGLLSFVRSELKNYQISFSYKISESKTVNAFDRKLFNLDIDY